MTKGALNDTTIYIYIHRFSSVRKCRNNKKETIVLKGNKNKKFFLKFSLKNSDMTIIVRVSI